MKIMPLGSVHPIVLQGAKVGLSSERHPPTHLLNQNPGKVYMFALTRRSAMPIRREIKSVLVYRRTDVSQVPNPNTPIKFSFFFYNPDIRD